MNLKSQLLSHLIYEGSYWICMTVQGWCVVNRISANHFMQNSEDFDLLIAIVGVHNNQKHKRPQKVSRNRNQFYNNPINFTLPTYLRIIFFKDDLRNTGALTAMSSYLALIVTGNFDQAMKPEKPLVSKPKISLMKRSSAQQIDCEQRIEKQKHSSLRGIFLCQSVLTRL